MIRSSGKSLVGDYFFFSSEHYSFMFHPGFSILDFHERSNPLNRDESVVRQDKTPLSDTGQFCLFTFLPEFTILSMFYNRHTEHL